MHVLFCSSCAADHSGKRLSWLYARVTASMCLPGVRPLGFLASGATADCGSRAIGAPSQLHARCFALGVLNGRLVIIHLWLLWESLGLVYEWQRTRRRYANASELDMREYVGACGRVGPVRPGSTGAGQPSLHARPSCELEVCTSEPLRAR